VACTLRTVEQGNGEGERGGYAIHDAVFTIHDPEKGVGREFTSDKDFSEDFSGSGLYCLTLRKFEI